MITTAAASINRTTTHALTPRELLRQYLKFTKFGLNSMVVLTTCAAFIVASDGQLSGARLAWTLLGTAMAALGSSGVNQYLERFRDGRMLRTRTRPLPAGTLPTGQALTVALMLCFSGDVLLGVLVNPLTAALALITQFVYLVLYTPLKIRTPLATLLGAVCGALPPMMGFTAVTGRLDSGAWIMGALLFAWQIPHSLALAWMYRDDYRRGGYRLLPILDTDGRTTFRMVLLYSLTLPPLALALLLSGHAGLTYGVGALVLGGVLVMFAWQLMREGSYLAARRLFLASVTYLPLLLLLMVLDRNPQPTHAADGAAAPRAAAMIVGR